MPSSRPGRRPTRSMRNERRLAAAAVPRVLVAVGSPPGAALPAMWPPPACRPSRPRCSRCCRERTRRRESRPSAAAAPAGAAGRCRSSASQPFERRFVLGRPIGGERDDRNVVGAGGVHGVDALTNEGRAPDRHHRVDEAVAAGGSQSATSKPWSSHDAGRSACAGTASGTPARRRDRRAPRSRRGASRPAAGAGHLPRHRDGRASRRHAAR